MNRLLTCHSIVICAYIFNYDMCISHDQPVDLTVVSSIDFNGSVRRHAVGLIDILKENLTINFIATRPVVLEGIPDGVKNVILNPNKTAGRVALLEDPLWYAHHMPESNIKIAFSVFESTKIPNDWVTTLNTKFDAVVLADPFYIRIYRDSGVTIPIFHLPLGIYIDEFLAKPLRQCAQNPFVFGTCARYFERKNHLLLIRAFAREYGNNPNVVLKMNGGGKWSDPEIFNKVTKLIKRLGVTNIIATNNALSWNDYVEYMSTMDCYINISTGEGFSITPREALARGIPTIVTRNTAQKTICKSNCVRCVPSNLLVEVNATKSNEFIGFRFNCTVADVRKALRDVYIRYDHHLARAHKGRQWAQTYRWMNLQNKYMNLIKPLNVIYGPANKITDDYLMTNSKPLFAKYQSMLAQQ